MQHQTFEMALKSVKILHRTQLSARTTAIVGHPFEHGQHSKYIALFLHDNATGRWFSMRLKTWRKLWHFMAKKNFIEVRRLNFIERWFTKPSEVEIEQRKINKKEKEKEKLAARTIKLQISLDSLEKEKVRRSDLDEKIEKIRSQLSHLTTKGHL